jgi:ubiquinone biosynthesis protein Coq4
VETTTHAYSAEPTRNPFRYLLAVWRVVRSDPTQSTEEAAIVEMGFARSRLGRRFARWEEMGAALKGDPRTADALHARRAFGPIDLARLAPLPEGTLGRVFADHCRERGLDPNLIHVPPTDEVGWMLNHLYQTHDIWHVVTGWDNDLPGEVGLGSFYAAQFRSPAFFGYMLALILLNVVFRRADLDAVMSAMSVGYRAGKQAEPLFGVDWDALWEVPLAEIRERRAVESAGKAGEAAPAVDESAIAAEEPLRAVGALA